MPKRYSLKDKRPPLGKEVLICCNDIEKKCNLASLEVSEFDKKYYFQTTDECVWIYCDDVDWWLDPMEVD